MADPQLDPKQPTTPPVETIAILAAIGARVIYGNERAFRDALYALRDQGYSVELACYGSAWNSAVHGFFGRSCERLLRWPFCDFPIRGYRLKCVVEFLPRYIACNVRFLLWLFRSTRKRRGRLLLCGDDVFLTLNFLPRLLGVPIVYRCGSVPPTHNVLRRINFGITKWVVARFVVDSAFMRSSLIALGVKADRIEVLRPMPPIR